MKLLYGWSRCAVSLTPDYQNNDCLTFESGALFGEVYADRNSVCEWFVYNDVTNSGKCVDLEQCKATIEKIAKELGYKIVSANLRPMI